MEMIMESELNGFVEIWGEIRLCHISIWGKGGCFNIRISGDVHDGIETVEEFIEQCKGKLYKSLGDYKKDKFVDLAKWVKKY